MKTSIHLTDTVLGHDLTLPTLPEVFARVTALAQDPESGAAEIGAVVSRDLALASSVLRAANSAAYGLRERVASTERATSVLGIRTLRNLVLQASVIAEYEHLAELTDLESLWRHSIVTGHVASELGRASMAELGTGNDELYTCGLLHDVGILVLLDCAREEYAEVLREARVDEDALWGLEEERLGFTHCEVGAMLARRWNLPEPIVHAILHHHRPDDGDDGEALPHLVSLAHRIAGAAPLSEPTAGDELLDPESEERLGLTRDAVGEIAERARELWGTVEV